MRRFKRAICAVLGAAMGLFAVVSLSGCGKTMIGFDADLANAVGEELGLKVEFKVISWDSKVTDLNAGYIDCVWNGMTILPELQDAMTLSIPYMSNQQIAVVRKEDASKYGSIDAIQSSDARITAEAGSAGEEQMNANFPDNEKKSAKDMMSALLDVSNNACQVAILDSILAGYMLTQDNSYAEKLTIVSGLSFSQEEYGIGFKKGNLATAAKVNETLWKLYNDGTITEIAEKYGLTESLKLGENDTKFEDVADKSDWEALLKKGKIVVGVTIFAPMDFYQE